MKKTMLFFLGAGFVIACVMLAGCSDRPVPQPAVTTEPAGSTATYAEKTPAAPVTTLHTATPVQTPLTFRTAAPQSLSCPAGYVAGDKGDSRCYASCNPGKRCRNADDFCCGTSCCSQGSICCGGNCYAGPCECSGGQCVSSHYEKPGIVVNQN